MIPGDQARVTALVEVEPHQAFTVFTEEIDQWWKRGTAYRVAGKRRGFIRIEGGAGGRLYESFETAAGTRVVETGRILAWEPPSRLLFEWRNANFAPAEKTEVEVRFEAHSRGTLVTVTHRGWSAIRADHPVRHGLEVPAFIRMMGMWWGDLMGALRAHVRPPSP